MAFAQQMTDEVVPIQTIAMNTEFLNERPLSVGPADSFAFPSLSPSDRAALVRLAERYQGEPYAQLTARQYMAFARTG